jgi:deoxyribonucleoside regulator
MDTKVNNYLTKAKISKLFFKYGMSKIEISKNLKISRFKVSKILEEALKEGIVNISIAEKKDSFMETENLLEEKFKIYRAIVVKSSSDEAAVKRNIGRAAADLLQAIVYDNDVIGIAWGTTIFEMMNFLPNHIDNKNITVVQLTGGSSQVPQKINASEFTQRLAEKFKAKSYYLNSPAILDNEKTKKILMSEIEIKNTLDIFNKVNIAIVGIGSIYPEPSTKLFSAGFINMEDLKNIIKKSAVGDINSFFYDRNGNECQTDLEKRVIGMNLKEIKKVRYVIGLSGGIKKIDAIYGALKGKLVNLIVTDNETAQKLLEYE